MSNSKLITALTVALLATDCSGAGEQRTAVKSSGQPDAATIRRIWAGPNEPGWPSRDGRFMAFQDYEKNAVMLRNLATGEARQVTKTVDGEIGAPNEMVPSPDGSSVAYQWQDYTDNLLRYELHVAHSDGSNNRVLVGGSNPSVYPEPMDWTRDGQHILAVIGDDYYVTAQADKRAKMSNQLVLLAADGSSRRVIKSLEWRWPMRPTFSPDDRYIAYSDEVRKDAAIEQLHIIDMQTGSETRIGRAREGLSFLGWSPDGASLLYATHDDGLFTIWRVAVQNGRQVAEPTIVRRGLAEVRAMGSTARGVFFGVDNQRRSLEFGAFDADAATVETPTRIIASEPDAFVTPFNALTKSGEYAAYGRRNWSRKPKLAIVLLSLRSGERREFIIPPPIEWIHYLRWDDEERDLLFLAEDRAKSRVLYRLPLTTGTPEPLPGPDTSVVSKDGRTRFTVVYDAPSRLRLGTVDLATGKRTTVFEGPVTNRAVRSPDQNRFVTSVPTDSGEYIVIGQLRGEGAGRVIRRYKALPGSAGVSGWSADGKYLLLIAPETPDAGIRHALFRLDLATGDVKMIAGSARQGFVNVQLTEDGRQILIMTSSPDLDGEIWLIDESRPDAAAARN